VLIFLFLNELNKLNKLNKLFMPDFDKDFETITESETRLEKPPLYKVVLHNDDFTTMEFVVFILKTVFHKNDAESFVIMMKVHEEGIGIAGIYTYEVANMKAEKAINLSRVQEFPLLCTVEEE
jgi:ATP-dependent Clp protease adaptor protein ClpS